MHPKKVEIEEFTLVLERIKNKLKHFGSRTVGFGEIGLDYDIYRQNEMSRHIQRQALRQLLQCFVDESVKRRLVLILHIRDPRGGTEASNDTFRILQELIPEEMVKKLPLHLHCFNYGIETVFKWKSMYPECKFGFTSLVMGLRAHSGIERVLRELPMDKLLLETDSPHLLAPMYEKYEKFNTPLGIDQIAKYISGIRHIGMEQVLTETSNNAQALYRFSK